MYFYFRATSAWLTKSEVSLKPS